MTSRSFSFASDRRDKIVLAQRLDATPRRSRILRPLYALLLSSACLLFACTAAAQDEDLRVLRRVGDGGLMMAYTDSPNALYHHVQSELDRLLTARSEDVAAVEGATAWRNRREHVREMLLDVVGPFPDRTPLNPRITGTVERDGYRIEKLIYESQPGYPVTAALFVPDELDAPAPAILYLSGHTVESFRSDTYQHVILNLVMKGFVVLAMDPIGQGERREYREKELGAVGEHFYPGAQLFLTGSSLARSMTWDGMRAIDYLVTRAEVDSTRIGVTGRSGGGTQTAYVAAMDDRVRAAAPENYITSLQRLWETRGPQDPEQHFTNGVKRGLDHADLLVARAPKHTLVLTTTRDIFSIQGARETYSEAKRAFAALGAADRLRMTEDDAGHQSTRLNREATYAFFQRALSHAGDSTDLAVDPLPDSVLRITPAGKTLADLYGETTFTLNRRTANELRTSRRRAAQSNSDYPASAVRAAKALSGYRTPSDADEPLFMGRYSRDGYAVEKYVLSSDGGYPIPFLLIRPYADGPHPAVLYLDPGGKASRAAPGGDMERLVLDGYTVVAPDLAGYGEMSPRDLRAGEADPRTQTLLWFGSVSVGRSLTGILAGDLVKLVRAVQRRPDVADGGIRAVGYGETASVLLHAAAFEPRISAVALVEPPVSYSNLASTRLYAQRFVPGGVAGMLTAYDLPDLAASLAPRPFLMLNPLDGAGVRLSENDAFAELNDARSRYAADGGQFEVRWTLPEVETNRALARWLRAGSSAAP